MLDVLRTRLSQKHRTMRYPDGPPPELPERFAGRPVVAAGCEPGVAAAERGVPGERQFASANTASGCNGTPSSFKRATISRMRFWRTS